MANSAGKVKFNIIGDIRNYFPVTLNYTGQDHWTVDYYIDTQYGVDPEVNPSQNSFVNDDEADGSAERPFKSFQGYINYTYINTGVDKPIIVIKGSTIITNPSDAAEVGIFVGDDPNTRLYYSDLDNLSARTRCPYYLNISVYNYNFPEYSRRTITYYTNLFGERDTSNQSTNKGHYGVVDLRTSTNTKPESELLGGYWYSLIITDKKETGGNNFCLFKGKASVNNVFTSYGLYFADDIIVKNNVEYSFADQRGNFNSDDAFCQYINQQLSTSYFGTTDKTKRIVLRYTFEELIDYDKDSLSFTLTPLGEQHLRSNYPDYVNWIPKTKNIPFYTNSDGETNCWDSNTLVGCLEIIDNQLYIDDQSLTKTGSITSKILTLDRATESISGVVSTLRYLYNSICDNNTYSSVTWPDIEETDLNTLSLVKFGYSPTKITLDGGALTISSDKEGLYVLDLNNSTINNPDDGNRLFYIQRTNQKAVFSDTQTDKKKLFRFNAGEYANTYKANTSLTFKRIEFPNNILGLWVRGTNTIKSKITTANTSLEPGCTYLALSQSVISLNGTNRTLVSNESIYITSSATLVSGELGLIFDVTDSISYYNTPPTSPYIQIELNKRDPVEIARTETAPYINYLTKVSTNNSSYYKVVDEKDFPVNTYQSEPTVTKKYYKDINYKYLELTFKVDLTNIRGE